MPGVERGSAPEEPPHHHLGGVQDGEEEEERRGRRPRKVVSLRLPRRAVAAKV